MLQRSSRTTAPRAGALHALGGEGSNLQPREPESRALPVAPPPNGRTANLADLDPSGDGRPQEPADPTFAVLPQFIRPGSHPRPPTVPHYERPPMSAVRVVVRRWAGRYTVDSNDCLYYRHEATDAV